MELSPSTKLVWIYSITKCNHAGIFELNDKLCVFQTGINKSLATVRQEIGKRWVTLECGKIFIPSFISFQYPKGLHDNVLAQKSVITELIKYDIWDVSSQTVRQEIGNTSLSVMDIDKDIEKGKGNIINKKNIKKDFVLPDWIPKKAWIHYVEMRTSIKKPMTSPAMKMAITSLIELTGYPSNAEAGKIAEKILNKSTFSNWQGLFPLDKDDRTKTTEERTGHDSKKDYREGSEKYIKKNEKS